MRRLALAVLTCLVPFLVAPAALARNGGVYFDLVPSWGFYDSTEAIIEDDPRATGPQQLPEASLVPALKVGLNLFGWAGVELHGTGHYWDLEGDPGGAAYVGGVFRVTPLEVLTYVLPDTVKLPSLIPEGPVTWKDRPFDLGVSVGGGYTLVGEDYAYQGSYFQWGLDFKWFITPNFALGLDLPFRTMNYGPVRISNFNERRGYCTDGKSAYVPVGGGRFPIPDGAGDQPGASLSLSDAGDVCDGNAPAASFFAPGISISGVIDFGI